MLVVTIILLLLEWMKSVDISNMHIILCYYPFSIVSSHKNNNLLSWQSLGSYIDFGFFFLTQFFHDFMNFWDLVDRKIQKASLIFIIFLISPLDTCVYKCILVDLFVFFFLKSLDFFNMLFLSLGEICYNTVKGEAVIFFIYSSGFYIGFYFRFTLLLLYWWW